MKTILLLFFSFYSGSLLPLRAQDRADWQMYGKLDMAYLSTNAGAAILNFNYISRKQLIIQSFFTEFSFLDKNGRDREVKNPPTHDVREYGICLGKNLQKKKYQIAFLAGLSHFHYEGIYNLQKMYRRPQFFSIIGNHDGYYYYSYQGKVSNSIGLVLKSEINYSLSNNCALGTGFMMNLNASRSYIGFYASVMAGKLRP